MLRRSALIVQYDIKRSRGVATIFELVQVGIVSGQDRAIIVGLRNGRLSVELHDRVREAQQIRDRINQVMVKPSHASRRRSMLLCTVASARRPQ